MKSINLIKELLNYLGKLSISKIKVEQQNAAYEGTYFELNGHQYRSRLAKMTPKKKVILLFFGRKTIKIRISLTSLPIVQINLSSL